MNKSEIADYNNRLRTVSPKEMLLWAFRTFPYQTAMTTSFQVSGTVLMHMIRDITFDFPLFFIDTGYHFSETREFKNRLRQEWNMNIHTILPTVSRKKQDERFGPRLYDSNPELCCRLNKQIPLKNLKKEIAVQAWISALRTHQGETRRRIQPVMTDADGFVRIHPLWNWTWNDVWKYIREFSIPYHPLYDKGYTSIGCFPPSCTQKNDISNGERAGRWKGKGKSECGLHSDLDYEKKKERNRS